MVVTEKESAADFTNKKVIMSHQANLFGEQPGHDAYGAALSHRDDPPTSAEAAAKHKSSGKLAVHAEIVLRLVQRHPGRTYRELFALASEDEQLVLGEPVELMRRLSGLRNDGKVRHGPARKCVVGKSMMTTWEPT